MQFQTGNNFWLARSSHGRSPIFDNPEKLQKACYEYFEWVEANPLSEEKVFHAQGVITKTTISKMRAMTISGLCLFLDICENTWANYKKNPDFLRVILQVERTIYNQKFTGAAADLLNANIIARELGLSEKQELKGKQEIKVMSVNELTDEQLAAIATASSD